jgi:excisionase family DNA binding protein
VVSERLLTAREVAGVLGVCPETVLRWTRKGALPGLRLPGGGLRYEEVELEAWLEARGTSAGTATEELSDTQAGRARSRESYSVAVPFESSDTRSPEAATTEEDDHAC